MPTICFEHKIEVFFVCKLDFTALCPMCIVKLKPDYQTLVVFTEHI